MKARALDNEAHVSLGEATLQAISKCQQLRELFMFSGDYSSFSALQTLRSLEHFDLSLEKDRRGNISDDSFLVDVRALLKTRRVVIFRFWSHLTNLTLRNCSTITSALFMYHDHHHKPYLRKLRQIALHECSAIKSIEFLRDLTELRTVNLSCDQQGQTIANDHVGAFLAPSAATLRKLYFANCNSLSVDSINTIGLCTRLTVLDLYKAVKMAGQLPWNVLARSLRNLRQLYLGHCSVPFNEVAELIDNNANLTHLGLECWAGKNILDVIMQPQHKIEYLSLAGIAQDWCCGML